MARLGEPRPSDLDPRPDLVDDHRAWVAMLSLAWNEDREAWGLLHGLRCGGARLVRKTSTRLGRDFFKMDYTPLLTAWDEDKLRSDWLEPKKLVIKQMAYRAPVLMDQVERQIETDRETTSRDDRVGERASKSVPAVAQASLGW